MRRLARFVGAAVTVAIGAIAAPALLRVAWSWSSRVAVTGHSMEPTLLAGDWLLVDPDAFSRRAPRIGELVVAVDPRKPDRILVKRVTAIEDGRVTLAGDHPAHAGDGEQIETVAAGEMLGQPWFRYWPMARFGRVG